MINIGLKKLTMLYIRLMFIGIKTGWAPVKKCLGAQLAPGEKMFKLCPCTQLKNILCIWVKNNDFRQCTKLNDNVQFFLWHNK
jgi:hypothetical protein